MPHEAKVSVVIPCRNEAASVVGLLEDLRRQEHPLHEVIVVDNASTDGTWEALEAFARDHPTYPLKLVRCERVGQPAALNAGIREATGEVIVRMDAHSRPASSYVRLGVELLRSSRTGVAGGAWDTVPGGRTVVAEAIARAVSHPMGAGDAAYRVGRRLQEPKAVDTVPFGCFLRSTWERLGGFNERILTNEDYEFNFRVRQSGQDVVLDPRIRSTYYARQTLGALARQYFRYGWWKAQMLRAHPKSLRWRQAVPAAFVTTVLTLGALGALLALAGRPALAAGVAGVLLALLGVYLAALSCAAWRISGGRRGWAILPLLPTVFACIHFCWGAGVLVNLVSGARWPSHFAALAAGRPKG
jgi:glycosyltransferase involved in cell wall biosynthesis